jgi:hypothetical protein
MRKTIGPERALATDRTEWLVLSQIASVEVTSEDPAHTIERAFECDGTGGWRAKGPGEQRIRVVFDEPTPLRRIHLHFREPALARTQEFALSWQGLHDGSPREILRQQWNFSPADSTEEVENYTVSLDAVASIELIIRPGAANAVASLECWRMA